jgi:hypothetical protein
MNGHFVLNARVAIHQFAMSLERMFDERAEMLRGRHAATDEERDVNTALACAMDEASTAVARARDEFMEITKP